MPDFVIDSNISSTSLLRAWGVINDWSVHFVLTRRLKRINNTIDSSVLAENKVISNTKTIQKVVSHQSKPIIYTSTRQALLANSLFINHTNDPKVYIPPFVDHSWREIQYFPWNDSLHYDRICDNVLKRITRNDTFFIISGSFNGGLGHKYLSVFHSITYAILLGRRFLLQLPESFWKETNSCFRQLRYYGGYKGLVVCRKNDRCNNKYISNYRQLPQANLVTIDFRSSRQMFTRENLNILKSLGIIKTPNWGEYQKIMYRLLLNPSPNVQRSIQSVLSELPSRWFSVAVHIRCAGNLADVKEVVHMITERQLGSVSRMIRSILTKNKAQSNNAVFVATDSRQALDKLTFLLKPIKVVSNKQIIRGHSTEANQTIVASSLTDLFLLTRSSTFIGVKRSGFSRVAMGISNPKRAKLIPV